MTTTAPPIETAPAPDLTRPARRLRPALLAERYALLVLFVLIMVAFSLVSGRFLSAGNVRIVLGSQGPLALFALAAMLPLVIGQFDLSVVAIGGASSIVLATTMSRFGWPLVPAVIAALVAGALLGLVNGLMVARVGVNAFIVTLAMATILQGVAQGYTGGQTISTHLSADLSTASNGDVGGIPRGLLWLIPVALLAWYVLEQTPTGRHLRSVGSNPAAARLLGLPVPRLTTLTFVFAGLVSAVAGTLLVGQTGDADPQTTLGALLLPALAAVFLGASAFRPGLFNVSGAVLAVYLVAFTISGLSFVSAASWIEPVLDGVVLAGAVTVTTYLRRRRRIT